jgi:hypothetical protein
VRSPISGNWESRDRESWRQEIETFHCGNPGIDLDRPNNGGHVSKDYPYRKSGIGDSGDPLTRDRTLALINPDL